MLDTHARGGIAPLIRFCADFFIKRNCSPTQVTILAFAVGLAAAASLSISAPISVSLLWISGLLDTVDGEIARSTQTQSNRGALLDLFFDRIVEVAFIIMLAATGRASVFALLLLACAIILSISMFLSVGALSTKQGMKAFYYQAGIMERTEGFILFSLIIILPSLATVLVHIFALLVLITAGQRLYEAWQLLN